MKLAIAGDSVGEHLADELYWHLVERSDLALYCLHREAGQLYPIQAQAVAAEVAAGTYDRAVLVCGTGIGMCIAANKVPGIRAALAHDPYSAQRAVLSNDAQVLTLGSRIIGPAVAKTIVDVWLGTVRSLEPSDNMAALQGLG